MESLKTMVGDVFPKYDNVGLQVLMFALKRVEYEEGEVELVFGGC